MTPLPPSWLEGGNYDAVGDRNVLKGLVARGGVARATDLVCTAGAAGALRVNVGPGNVFVEGGTTPMQGTYGCCNDDQGDVTVTLAPAHPTLPRIDLIVAKVRDVDFEGTQMIWEPVSVQGDAATVPQQPSLPVTSEVIGQAYVDPGITTLSPAAVTAGPRRLVTLSGGTRYVADTTERDALTASPGDRVFVGSSGRMQLYVPALGWRSVAVDGADASLGSLDVAGTLTGPTISGLSALLGYGALRTTGDLNFVSFADTPDGIWMSLTNANASYGTLVSFKATGFGLQIAVSYGVGNSNDPSWAYASARTFNTAQNGWGPWWRLA